MAVEFEEKLLKEFQERLKKANQAASSQAQQPKQLPQQAGQTRDYKTEHDKARREILDAINAKELLQIFRDIVFAGHGSIDHLHAEDLRYEYTLYNIGEYRFDRFGTRIEAEGIARSPGYITQTHYYKMYSLDGYALEEGTAGTHDYKLVVVGFGFKHAKLPNPHDGRSEAILSVGCGKGRKARAETARRLIEPSIYHILLTIESTAVGKTTHSGRSLKRPGFYDPIDNSLLNLAMRLIAMNALEYISSTGYLR